MEKIGDFSNAEGSTMEVVCLNDQQLWEMLRSGSKDALTHIYQAYFFALYNYGINICGEDDLVKDSIQELFIYVWKKKENLGNTDSIKNYLFKSLRRSIIAQRKQKRHTLFNNSIPENYHFEFVLSHEHQMIDSEVSVAREKELLKSINHINPFAMKKIKFYYSNHLPYFAGFLGMIFICCLPLSMSAQDDHRLSFHWKDTNSKNEKQNERYLNDVLSELESRFQVQFNYLSQVVEGKKVKGYDAAVEAAGLDAYIKRLLVPLKLTFDKVSADQYIIYHRKDAIEKIQSVPIQPGGVASEKSPPSFLLQKNRLNSSSLLEITVRGTVTDNEDRQPLPGVNVVVKNTTIGAITDIEGKYTLTVPDDQNIIVFSSVGYVSQEVQINDRTIIDMALAPDIQALSEVVVVGYGTQEKRDVTAAIASLDNEQIAKIPVASGVQAMQGQVAGVDIMSQGGRPGQNPSVRIRGRRSITASNDPLYVIDGIPQTSSTSAIFDINPQDIESMEVLKDAAATSVYGSRGSNGVILITTKRGSSGKSTISYDGYYGISQAIRTVDMMNGPEFGQMKRESRRIDPETGQVSWDGVIPPDEAVFLDPVEATSLAQNPVRSTDYQDLILNRGWQTNQQLGVRGGNDKTQFNVSLGYFKEQGIIESMDYQRTTGRINLDHQFNDIIKIGMSSLISHSIQNWGSNATFEEAISNNPLGVPYDEGGNLIFLPTNDGIRTNPLNELLPGAYVDERKFSRIFAPVYLEAKLAEGLQYKVTFGPDIRYSRQGEFRGSLTNSNRGGPAAAEIENRTDIGYTLENLVTWNKTFAANHDLRVTLLQSIQSLRTERNGAAVQNLPYESQEFYNIGTAEVKGDLSSYLEEWSLASYMGRINYGISDKYLFQATLRADGSSRLAEATGNKWAYFPGLSAGWRIIDEGFMSDVNFLTELKLRASYGSVGNTSVDPYQTFGRLRRTTYAWDESPAFGYLLDEIPNPDLVWEISSTFDVGVDFGLFNGRLSGSFDWYQTNTTALLLNRNLPYTSGYDNILQNIGATETKGVELSLVANVIDNLSGFTWDINFNVSRYTEAITELALKDENGNAIDDIGNEWFIGEPIKVYYDYQKAGIWQADEATLAQEMENKVPGEIKLADLDNDGAITPDDRTILGTDIPDYFGGITNSISYKGFDFSFFFYYRMGHMIRSRFHDSNNTLFARYNNIDVDYWTIDNPTNAYPRPKQNQERPRNASTLSYFDGSYVKLRNVMLGYSFPSTFAERIGLGGLRVYASAQNPWFWAKYETFDPEVGDPEASDSGEQRDAEVGANTVPSSKLFLVGIKIQL